MQTLKKKIGKYTYVSVYIMQVCFYIECIYLTRLVEMVVVHPCCKMCSVTLVHLHQ